MFSYCTFTQLWYCRETIDGCVYERKDCIICSMFNLHTHTHSSLFYENPQTWGSGEALCGQHIHSSCYLRRTLDYTVCSEFFSRSSGYELLEVPMRTLYYPLNLVPPWVCVDYFLLNTYKIKSLKLNDQNTSVLQGFFNSLLQNKEVVTFWMVLPGTLFFLQNLSGV